MKSLIHTVYRNGQAGLSNQIMSLELGVVLSSLTDRVLVLRGNNTPTGNVVHYGDVVRNTYPSRVTDLMELGVPWIDADEIDLTAFVPHELCNEPAWDCVFYFPAHLCTDSDDMQSFAGRRSTYITVSDDLQNVPALSFSAGPGSDTLCFYSYFFYLDRVAQSQACQALLRMKPKCELSTFAKRVAKDLSPFNSVHIRRGDFKKTGMTTLDRTPVEAIGALNDHFTRDDRLVILTDEADDPFFEQITSAFRDYVFLDRHILQNYGAEFSDLPVHDSIALAYLSQLIAAEAQDFVGSMMSTFTALIQRMRGNQGKDELFKFLWNELPAPDGQRGVHSISNCITLEKGLMVEERDGPYSWNRYSELLNPAWMREWPESFLNEVVMAERVRNRMVATTTTGVVATTAAVPHTDSSSFFISFLDAKVAATSNRADVIDSIRQLFAPMVSVSDVPAIAEVRVEDDGAQAKLLVNGEVVANEIPTAPKLLRSFYREIVCRFIDWYPNLVWLHAGCVASPKGAMILPGEWGRGKSSLVAELYRRGWSFLSDDVVPLNPENGTVIPFPGTPQIRANVNKAHLRDEIGNIPKLAMLLDPAKVADDPRAVVMIVFPYFANGTDAELTALSPARAVGELLNNCLSFVKNDDATIHRLCAVVEALPAYYLRFDNVANAAELLIDAMRTKPELEAYERPRQRG